MITNGTILRVENIRLAFGGLVALSDVSLMLKANEILGLIGPNGSGKTCLLNCINGFYRTQKGKIYFENREITRLATHKIAQLGVARVFQHTELYTGLSVVDNLMAARYSVMKQNLFDGALYFGKGRREEIKHREIVEYIIDFLEMQKIRKEKVGLLPYGLRKRVDLGRALALEPKVLLLDEPMAGMNLEEKEDMARFILDISELKKIPIIIVEHDMGVIMSIAGRTVVLDEGHVIAEGTPDAIAVNREVINCYLGSALM